MKKTSIAFLFTCLLALTSTSFASTSALTRARQFFEWLNSHFEEFSSCEVQKTDIGYRLCDATVVSKAELQKLFKMKTPELVKFIKAKKITLEVLCDESDEPSPLKAYCKKSISNKMFQSVTPLHGQFLPKENKILLRSRASHGSLVHEYLHYLEFHNTSPIYGKHYKKERISLQNELTVIMDKKIVEVQKMQHSGKTASLKSTLAEFMQASDLLRQFAFWQDLIDERSLFQLYINFGKEFGVDDQDIEFSKKNMETLCHNPKLKSTLPSRECSFD